LNALKESCLSDSAKRLKTIELQSLLKEWKNAHEMAQMGLDKPGPAEPTVLMGATGPLVLIADKSRKISEPAIPTRTPPEAAGGTHPPRPERQSVRRKITGSPQPAPAGANGGVAENQRLSRSTSNSSSTGGLPPSGELPRSDSKMSISQIGTPTTASGMWLDVQVPELSYGINQRMPSASIAIDLRFAQERGRFFVATQDLLPGKIWVYKN
jgi:hypothetical protein